MLLLLLAAHLGTLYCHWETGSGGDVGYELLVGGGVLCSVLLVLAVSCLLPETASYMCRAWLAAHVTRSDDTASLAVRVLYEAQVVPLVDAFGLSGHAAALPTLEFWWWSLQGLLLVLLVRCLAASGSASEDESDGEVTEVVVGTGRVGCVHEEARVDMPDLLALCYQGHRRLDLTPVSGHRTPV